MKCQACGYEKLGYGRYEVPGTVTFYKSGHRKGQVKTEKPADWQYGDRDPDKRVFFEIKLIGHEFVAERDYEARNVALFGCPICKTVQFDTYA